MKINWLIASLFIVMLGQVSSVTADERLLKFVNQDGKPLANLVVEITTNLQSYQQESPKQKIANKHQSHVMDQIDKSFKPELLLIWQGDDVSFPNSDNIRHHVYSFSAVKPFELKLYSGRPTSPITFPQHGVVTLGCNIHDSMVGFIYVAKSPMAFVTDLNGEIKVANSNSVAQLTAWHPQQKLTPELPQLMDINLLKRSGTVEYTIETMTPPARDTFGAKFKDAQ